MLSGSNKQQANTDEYSKEIAKPLDEEMINNFMNQILDSAWVEEDLKAMHAPSYHLSKENKTYWLMNTSTKSLFNIKGGIEIIPIELGENNTLCLIGQSTYSIPNKYIIQSGWN